MAIFAPNKHYLVMFLCLLLWPAMPSAAQVCVINADCDDPFFCNGVETCDPVNPLADPITGCVPGSSACDDGFTWIIVNFFDESKDPCAVKCNPAGAVEDRPAPQFEISVADLVAQGLGQYVREADIDRNGVVNLADVSQFLQRNAFEDPALANDLLDAVDAVRRDVSAGLR